MAATSFLHRLLIVGTVARTDSAAFKTWWQANVDAADDPSTWPGLSAAGLAPTTHRRSCGAYQAAGAKKVLDRWYALALMTPPDWTTMTRAQIRTRIATDRAALFAGSGLWVSHSDNDGTWDDPQAALTTLGLQVIQTALP